MPLCTSGGNTLTQATGYCEYLAAAAFIISAFIIYVFFQKCNRESRKLALYGLKRTQSFAIEKKMRYNKHENRSQAIIWSGRCWTVRRKLICAALAAALILIGSAGWSILEPGAPALAVCPTSRTLIIDAGHGGEDGGAVSITGAAESQINLAIACRLEDILALYGVAPQMLRREDVSLHDSGASTLREKKVSDLHNRVDMIETADSPLLVSIHQNSYPEQRYHGSQVFYAPTQNSKEIAQHFQQVLTAALDPDNGRAAKQIPDNVYLMNHITCPAVLVECGFLTNPEEEALLRQEGYQRKIAAALASAVLTAPEYSNENAGA